MTAKKLIEPESYQSSKGEQVDLRAALESRYNATSMTQMTNPRTMSDSHPSRKFSTYDYGPESYQSGLDKQFDQEFNEERRHNTSSMIHMENSRMVGDSFSSGYQTLDNSSDRHHNRARIGKIIS